MYVVNKRKGKVRSLPAKEISGDSMKALASRLSRRILETISSEQLYPRQIAKRLRENEQSIYYHIRKLESAGLIAVSGEKTVSGVKANLYSLREKAFVIRFGEYEEDKSIGDVDDSAEFLEPFIEAGKLNAVIIVGSPDPHGPQKARSRDGYYGIDLALFFGTFLRYLPKLNVRLDTEVREEDLSRNLVILGGPIVNTVSARVNPHLPIRFDKSMNIVSTLSKKTYMDNESGMIVKADNPFNPRSKVLVIAGKRHAGTRAVMLAFLERYEDLSKGNLLAPHIMAKVVEGFDMDSDGIVDSVEILE